MEKTIIGFGHKRKRGKDTSAHLLYSLMNGINIPTRKDSFALTLKEVCATVFGFTEEQLNGDLKEVEDGFWGFTPRWALQTVGTEAFRQNVSADVWVRSLEKRFLSHSSCVIVTDVRFPNEAEMIQKHKGFVIKCERDVPFDEKKDCHPSETALDGFDKWDFEIDNNGTKESLMNRIQEILTQILERTIRA